MSTAARPKYIGVVGPGDGLAGDRGREEFDMLFNERRDFIAPVEVKELCVRAREVLRVGAMNEDDRRDMEEIVRGAGLGLMRVERPVESIGAVESTGLCTRGPLAFAVVFSESSSVHCR